MTPDERTLWQAAFGKAIEILNDASLSPSSRDEQLFAEWVRLVERILPLHGFSEVKISDFLAQNAATQRATFEGTRIGFDEFLGAIKKGAAFMQLPSGNTSH